MPSFRTAYFLCGNAGWHTLTSCQIDGKEVTAENGNAFRLWLEKEWAELPDALPTKMAASLIGCQPQRIYELIKENVLHGIKISAVQYIPKSEFISYAASPEKLSKPTSDAYRELIREFKKRQCMKNAKRRENRKI